ncbi:Non-catalytic module family DOC2 [Piromyces sp. E2]|nr:Non-catalytic module family DOC2 [Piromyces sp. E2]|eukprot:OUM64944.1 Non-catalytic module family DOC2 [Piromyces sp. E2]
MSEADYDAFILDANSYEGPGGPPTESDAPPPPPPGGGPGGPGGPPMDFDDPDAFRFEEPPAFKTKDATLTVEFPDEVKSFKKINFSIGGSTSRHFAKQGFNIKIRGKEDLYGRSNIRLRPDFREPTLLRSKLACDIQNRIGVPSVSANFAKLYINDNFMGLYVLLDAFKLSWVETVYGEKDSTSLIQCKSMDNNLTYKYSINGCVNENEDVTDKTEWGNFLTALDKAETPEELEQFFDVDTFLKNMAYEFLAGSWDHYLSYGHNFYVFKPQNSKWQLLEYDFDSDFGCDCSQGIGGPGVPITNFNFAEYPLEKWHKPRHLLDVLVYQNSTRFENILKQQVKEVFNPAIIFPHIDKLKEFIKPYIIEDYTPDENGKYPGRINEKAILPYNMTHWDANIEFTTVRTLNFNAAYGLKNWFLERYRSACKIYNIDCDETYLDENYETPIDKSVEVPVWTSSRHSPPQDVEGNKNPIETVAPNPTETIENPVETETVAPNPTETIENPVETETVAPVASETPVTPKYDCWVAQFGYSCCNKNIKTVYHVDEEGEWGFNFKTQEWCGITPYAEKQNDEKCWSKTYGYPCCKTCYVYEEDEYGKWGYDFNENTWCGIQSFCKN